MQDVHGKAKGPPFGFAPSSEPLENLPKFRQLGFNGRATNDHPGDLVDYELAGRLALGLRDPDWRFLAVSDFSTVKGVRLG